MLKKIFKHISSPFRTIPIQTTNNYSQNHLDKGENYERIFSQKPGTKMMWDFEYQILLSIISHKKYKRHLDFAGGTGRIASVFHEFCEEQYILDISKKMLDVARKKIPDSIIICKNFKDAIPELKGIKFDIVTAFRFFPNAEDELKDNAMEFISNILMDEGLFICNNHRNFWSIPYFSLRFTYLGGLEGMSHKQMVNISERWGLKLVDTFSIGIIPQTEEKTILISWNITQKIEKYLFYFFKKHKLGYNVIYVFKK